MLNDMLISLQDGNQGYTLFNRISKFLSVDHRTTRMNLLFRDERRQCVNGQALITIHNHHCAFHEQNGAAIAICGYSFPSLNG